MHSEEHYCSIEVLTFCMLRFNALRFQQLDTRLTVFAVPALSHFFGFARGLR
jgi:hypothetical protein